MPDDKLIEFVEQLSGEVHLRVEESLGSGFVRLRSAEAERRQAK
ncbi:MAG: ATP-binding protein, partial [Coriobacteriia bacterium]|nr:ATP-binding protein [Coriobacteriia bacterium]